MTTLFTVIVPTHNRADLLRITLKSLKWQTFTDYEAFIIDDGSTDNTPEVFKEFAGQANWNFIRFETNRRQAYCRNHAMRLAKGSYITFLDADDLWLPDRLEKFASLTRTNPGAGFIFSNGYIMQDDLVTGKFFEEARSIPRGKLPPYMAISAKWLPYVTTNVAFTRKVLDTVGFFREDMSHLEDMELYVRILKHFEADHIAEPLSIYRIHSLTKSPKSLTLKWDDGIKDFLIALETASPPPEDKRILEDHVYLEQAVVFLKNSFTTKAREYLLKTSARDARFYFIYAATFLPSFVLAILKVIYRTIRTLKARSIPGADFSAAQDFLKNIQGY